MKRSHWNLGSPASALLLLAQLAIGQSNLTAEIASVPAPTTPLPAGMTSIFDGRTMDGWIQEPLNATTFGGGDIADADSLAKKLVAKADPVSAFLANQMDEADSALIALPTTPPTTQSTKDLKAALARALTKAVAGPPVYAESRFKEISLRPETQALLRAESLGRDLARLNRVLLEDAFPKELGTTLAASWTVKNGVLASLGAGRGVIHTAKSFGRYRIIFDIRHAGASTPKQEHSANVLVFCTAPTDGQKPLDALGGIQFQVPNGGHWDYRKGHNNGGKEFFTQVPHTKFDPKQWSRVEILVDPATGTGRMAVAQPVGSKAVEVLQFKDPTAGQNGPFALQMHNKGLFDEFANIAVEENPSGDELVTMK